MSNPNEVVNRWNNSNELKIRNPDGEYVLYSSYQSLELENKRLREALIGLLEADGGDLKSYRSHPEGEEFGSELFIAVPKAIQALEGGKE